MVKGRFGVGVGLGWGEGGGLFLSFGCQEPTLIGAYIPNLDLLLCLEPSNCFRWWVGGSR